MAPVTCVQPEVGAGILFPSLGGYDRPRFLICSFFYYHDSDNIALDRSPCCLWLSVLFSQLRNTKFRGVISLFFFIFQPPFSFHILFLPLLIPFSRFINRFLCLAWGFIFGRKYLFILLIQNKLGIFIRGIITPGTHWAFTNVSYSVKPYTVAGTVPHMHNSS